MKAAVLYANEDIRYADWETPVCGDNDVKVRVRATGICGSDVPRVLHNGAHFYPVVLGHEFSGDVVETGRNVTKIKVGDTVSGAPLSKGEDFKVKYSDNINVGTATVKVSGINTYKMFSSIVNFAILTRDISEAEIDSIADQHYTGSEITPALRVIYNGKLLR